VIVNSRTEKSPTTTAAPVLFAGECGTACTASMTGIKTRVPVAEKDPFQLKSPPSKSALSMNSGKNMPKKILKFAVKCVVCQGHSRDPISPNGLRFICDNHQTWWMTKCIDCGAQILKAPMVKKDIRCNACARYALRMMKDR
jgi:DNA-directed RNA polymerase subunit RPC12/RpoP